MRKVERGYKLLSNKNHNLTSWWIGRKLEQGVRYITGRWVKPKKGAGPLMVLGSITQGTRRFSRFMRHKETVRPCEFVRSADQSKVWQTAHGQLKEMDCNSFWQDTVLANEVRILPRSEWTEKEKVAFGIPRG